MGNGDRRLRTFIAALALGVIGCTDASRAAPPPPAVVKVESVVERDVSISVEYVGTLRVERERRQH
jgi:multidrug efflux pump subunit AcrA (membrane-fusion protein)